ncbi:cyclic AMP-dependent transcription factor ATF-1-like isoform X2 [Pseudochaenichthys georgianus]|uniref:cyclic AMP-dependent transcription factor ATF-1-like isoform X2 n=1 Tax=Pseudochaenichthys georgianus TaxID=52239 RepID=UPI00146E5157|nr:cyclic AMP-dependent transcription factor ATF-1-like isoform X2 [Pseudochaenichthys georgianus]
MYHSEHPDQQHQSLPVRMNKVKNEGTYQPGATMPFHPTPKYQNTNYNQLSGYYQGTPINFYQETTQDRLFVAMPSAQIPHTQSSTFQYYREPLNCQRDYVGFSQGDQVTFPLHGMESLPSAAKSNTNTPRMLEYSKNTFYGQQENSTSGDLTACQLQNTGSSLPQGGAETSTQGFVKSANPSQKREQRLMKNREAARECRRKKKEYVKCLENRVAVLENQNKTLIDELSSLKDIYRHKVE